MTDTLYLVRSQGFGPMARTLAERLASTGVPVVAVVDERAGVAETSGFDKIVLDPARLEAMGFTGLPADWGWLCGDLCYYLAAADRPGFARYCLVESDVFLPEAAALPLVTALAAHPAEAIAAQLGSATGHRRYSRRLADFGLDPTWGCIFPLTRVTPKVIEAMRALRVEQLQGGAREPLNDEAILAGAVLRGNFPHARLEDVLPDHVGPETFHTNPPHLLEGIAGNPLERRLFHPVVPFETVMERLRTGDKNYSRRRLRHVLNTAPKAMKKAIRMSLHGSEGMRVHRRPDLMRMNGLVAALAPERRLRVLDVGANPLIEGEVSYRRLLDQGHAEVIGFEPQADALAALNERKSPAERYLPHVLGDGSPQTLRLTSAPGFTSIFPADADSARLLDFTAGMAETSSLAVETHRLDDLADVPRIDFLKIDVQGSEQVIMAHGRDRLSEAIAVQTEVRMFPIYLDEPGYGGLERELAAQGFRFLRFASLKHVGLSRRPFRKRLKRSEFAQAVDGDAFFVRDLRRAGDWSDEALKRLAILADGVMDCPDLVLFALDLLRGRGRITAEVSETYLASLPASRLRG